MLKKLLPTLAILLFPLPAYAAACLEQGATVVYVNGIFTTYEGAQEDLGKLREEYRRKTKDKDTGFINGFNPSHLAGGGDLIKSWVQTRSTVGTYVNDYDLKTILLNLHDDLTTKQVMLVGHSQGTFYTNDLYHYLTDNGVSKKSIGVYNVATPATFVAGGGKYLNSSGDVLLAFLRDTFGLAMLSDNIALISSPDDAKQTFPGHSFSGAYLAEAPDRIISDISGQLSGLAVSAGTSEGGCFTAPSRDTKYKLQKMVFAIADPTAIAVRDGAVAGGKGVAAVGSAVVGAGKKVYAAASSAVRSVLGLFAPAPQSENRGNLTVKPLHGWGLTQAQVKEYMGHQGSAVASAPVLQKKADKAPGLVLGAQTKVPYDATKQKTVRGQRSHSGNTQENPQPEVVPVAEEATTTPTVVVEQEVATSTASTTVPVEPEEVETSSDTQSSDDLIYEFWPITIPEGSTGMTASVLNTTNNNPLISFTPASSMSVAKICLAIDSYSYDDTETSTKLGIYEASSTTVNALITESDSPFIADNVVEWYFTGEETCFSYSSPVPLTAGTPYIFGVDRQNNTTSDGDILWYNSYHANDPAVETGTAEAFPGPITLSGDKPFIRIHGELE